MINRYDLEMAGTPYMHSDMMVARDDGEWVRWDDVKDLVVVPAKQPTSAEVPPLETSARSA